MTEKNHLAGQSSPYLRQHAYNPVDWYPWGEEALAKAGRENKPLLVSIGYSACHWCHVMERECFEDREVARIMNRHFVSVKVDREERPDIDHLYINAVQMITGQAGWPLNCFALPDGRPFWGGTYFSKEQWLSILERVAEIYHEQHDQVLMQAENIKKGLVKGNFITMTDERTSFAREEVERMAALLMDSMDWREGGTKGAPKFPLPGNHSFLLHYYYQTNDKNAWHLVNLSLRKMAMGGIYDQLGGGFSRYSTDPVWKVPHFEKMLYDNGQLVSLYAAAWKISPDPLFKETVYGTIDFLVNELTSPNGVFYSALDADSEGEEGKYYLWTEEEINDILGEDANLIKDYYQVGNQGAWEHGNNILFRGESDESFARRMNIDLKTLKDVVNRSKRKLLDVRQRRVRPGLDDKVLVGWNALMIQGLVDAYAAFQDEKFLQLAMAATDFILTHAKAEDGRLYRSLQGTEADTEGFLEDYALLAMALISLYEVSMREPYLYAARNLVEYGLDNFSGNETRLFAFSSQKGKPLVAPYYEFIDNVIPSSNSVMARVMFYLADYFELPDWTEHSRLMLADLREYWSKYSSNMTGWGKLLLHCIRPLHTLVITGPQAPEKAKFFHQRFLPDTLLAAKLSDESDSPPVFEKRFEKQKTLFYVCSQGHCKLPVENERQALAQME